METTGTKQTTLAEPEIEEEGDSREDDLPFDEEDMTLDKSNDDDEDEDDSSEDERESEAEIQRLEEQVMLTLHLTLLSLSNEYNVWLTLASVTLTLWVAED